MFQEFPLSAKLPLALTVTLILSAWVLSIIQAFRSKQHRIFAIIPVTQPLLALQRLFASGKANKVPGCLILSAALLFFVGPKMSETIERSKLFAWIHQLAEQGYQVELKNLFPTVEDVPEEQNIWLTPYLKPIYQFAERLSTKEEVDSALQEKLNEYDIFQPEDSFAYLEFKSGNHTPIVSGSYPFQRLIENSVKVQVVSNFEENFQPPKLDLQSAAKVMAEFYYEREDSFNQLKSALSREKAAFYYDVNRSPHQILLPHLVHLKRFSVALNDRLITRLILNQPEEAWQDWETLLLILKAHDQDANLLITRLVNQAQYQIMIESVHIAQATNAWDLEKWIQLESHLMAWNVRKKMFDAMKTEMAFMTTFATYSANHPPTTQNDLQKEIINTFMFIDSENFLSHQDYISNFELELWSHIAPSTIRALIYSKLKSGLAENLASIETILDAYGPLDEADNSVTDTTKEDKTPVVFKFTVPKSLEKSDGPKGSISMERIYEKSLTVDTRVQMALLACRLEQYRKTNGEYPETLDPIQDSGLEMLSYEKTSSNGFTLEINLPDWVENVDKVTWEITGEFPEAPEYTVEIF